jgi:molybdate transport system permease protein
VVEAGVGLPLVLPPTVLGFYLLVLLGPATAPGRLLVGIVGHPLAFTFWGLVIGSILYSLPFAVQPVLAGFRGIDPALLESADLLGASRLRIAIGILLPGARASVLAAAVLCFAHTVGEFGVVLMLGGSIPGVTRTLSIALYDQVMSGDYAASNHMALALVAISLAALLVVYSVARPGVRGETGGA